jgi:O-antigen/teichoic acid export membrane protein
MDIFKFFIGSSTSGYHEGIKVVPWLLLGNLFLGIFYTQSLWYKLTDKTHFGARFAIVGAIITIVVNIILIPVFGFMACGYAFFAASLVMTISSYFVGQKYFPVNYDLKRMGVYLLTSVVLYLIEIAVVIGDKLLKIGFNTILLILFLFVIWHFEKGDLKRLFIAKSR